MRASNMKVCHTLICFFLTALQDGNTGVSTTEILVRTVTEGENIRVGCSFNFFGSRKILCKGECKEQDTLIDTIENIYHQGRYSIEYERESFGLSSIMYVNITNLKMSDSGRYRCSLDRKWLPDSSDNFEIKVKKAPVTPKPNWNLRPFPTSVPSASTLTTTTKSLSSSSGRSTSSSASSTPSSASPENANQSEQERPSAADQTGTLLLYVGLTLVAMVIVLSAAVLILCRKRARKPKEHLEEMEDTHVTEQDNREYEEIREVDRQRRPPPVEISIVYSCAKFTTPNATTDESSLITAASSQDKTEDASSKLTYSEVDFSNGAAASLNSAPCGDADNVIYSVPLAEDTSAPLYSTVKLHQL